jgi:hypothetical protein
MTFDGSSRVIPRLLQLDPPSLLRSFTLMMPAL